MVDYHVVCSLCGDVGFPDKLFRCSNGCNRFQHSYCSNYYCGTSEAIEVCDWCKSEEEKKVKQCESESLRKFTTENDNGRINHHNDRKEGSSARRKNTQSTPSPRTATRRYKLLKDVMC